VGFESWLERDHVIVRQALAEPRRAAATQTGNPASTSCRSVQNVPDTFAGESLTVWEIWATVTLTTDQHDSDASYAAIRDYIRTRRLAGQLGPPPDQ
jgi:hypothetical protein